MSKFDAVINWIHKPSFLSEEHKRTAIRFLRIGGKINKEVTLLAFGTICDLANVDGKNKFVNDIYALLNALPEGDKDE
jgi:hypothetical protein